MKPQPVGDLKFVRASHRSPYGLIASEWRKEAGVFDWQITVPANTTATVFVPAKEASRVSEGSQPAAHSPGVEFLRMSEGRAVFRVGSGDYHFVSK
jgi:alpha-L-rhamnosidase